MKKLVLCLALALLMLPMFGGVTEAAEFKVGVVFSIGGLGDESFNDLAYAGVQQAKDELNIHFSYVEPEDIAEMEEHQRYFAEAGYDMVIAVGFLQESAMMDVAPDYPDTKFAIVDTVVDLPNVASLIFAEHEGSFLVGVVAGMMTKTNTVGFVGGMEVPVIRKFQSGFEQGVEYINPDARILISYAGAFDDPGRGKELAVSQHARDADIIFHAAGASGIGVIDAAAENGFYAIGVDDDQDHVAPGYVLTSMLKRVNVAVYEAIASAVDGTFEAGIKEFGIAEDGVGTSLFSYTREDVPVEVFMKLGEVKALIEMGVIEVTDPTL